MCLFVVVVAVAINNKITPGCQKAGIDGTRFGAFGRKGRT